MNVRTKMDDLLNSNPSKKDGGIYNIDGGEHGILHNENDGTFEDVYESNDDIDEHGNREIKIAQYPNVKGLLEDLLT